MVQQPIILPDNDMIADAQPDWAAVKADFPALWNGRTIYLDSASSAQKPDCVLQAMDDVARTHYANVHRGLYGFSQKTTTLYEAVRGKVKNFIGAHDEREIVFTRNATEAVNLVAYSWGRANLSAGDEIILTELEHHANIVPWMMVAKETGAVIRTVPITSDGQLDIEAYKALLSPKVKLVAFSHMSNVLGTIQPVHEMVMMAKNVGAVTLVDGCQAVAQMPVNVAELGCDFYVFTGHKLYGPTGVGVLYGRYVLLDAMRPFNGGGDMIEKVSFEHVEYKKPPHKFEAGTPAILEVIGLGTAIDYVSRVGTGNIATHNRTLTQKAMQALEAVDGLTIYGPSAELRGGVISFAWEGVHPQDLATILDQERICVRVGHHCAMPLMARLGVQGTMRLSFGIYNNEADIDALITALKKAEKLLK